MEWATSFFGRLMKSSSSSSSTSNTPWFVVDSTEPFTADVPELTVRELNRATQSFSAARLIGQANRYNNGTAVYRATLPDGTAAAAKVLGSPPSRSWGATEDAFLRQHVSLLSTLRHDNLVRLLGYTIAPDLRVLLFEFATAGTLHDVLHGPRGEPEPGSSSRPATVTLSWAQRTRIALDAARGLQYLHEEAAVSHWGVRSTNVLLFQGLRAKIDMHDVFDQGGDMSVCCRRVTDIYVWYHPPEYLKYGSRLARKTDVYSFGVVLLELLTGRKSFDVTLDPSHVLVHWATPLLKKGGIEQWIDPKLGTQYPQAGALKLARIAQQCLHDQPRSRPSMGAVAQMISNVVRD
ncbi:unnamed protein product [Urochloa humidicola]